MFQYLFSTQPFWFFLLALAATWLLRQRSPNICYLLWTFFLIKLMLPFGIYEGAVHFDFFHPEVFEFTPSGENVNVSNAPFLKSSSALTPQPVNRIVEKRDRLDNRSPLFFLSSSDSSVPFSFFNTFRSFFLLAWVGLSLLLLVFKSWKYFRFREKVRTWTIVRDGELYAHFLCCAKKIGLHRIPILRIAHEDYPIPFAMGLSKKSITVVIPQSLAKTKDVKTLHVVLCHELVHIKKRDQYVNLLRFMGLICFHCHPLRLLADRFVQGFQEITTDLITIESMRVNKKTYVSILLSSFMDLEKNRSNLAHLSVPFFEGDISVVKRLFFIKHFDPSRTPATRFVTYFLSLLLFGISFVNLSIYASYPFMSELVLDEERGRYPFPDAVQTYPTILHDTVAVPKIYKERLFVLEPRFGLFVYRLDEMQGPILISSYLMDSVGDDNTEWWKDFDFDQDTIYVSVEDRRGTNTDRNRIEILSIADDFTMEKVGAIERIFCNALKTVDRRLYVCGRDVSTNINKGFVKIFDLSPPDSPVLVKTENYDWCPTGVELNDEDRSLFVLAGEKLFYYSNREIMNSPKIVDLGITTIYVRCVDPNQIIICGQKNSNNRYIILLSRGKDKAFKVTDIVKIDASNGNAQWGMDVPFIRDQALFSSFPGCGMGVFSTLNQRVEMLSFSTEKYTTFLPCGESVISLYPETSVFNVNDFIFGPNRIIAWNE